MYHLSGISRLTNGGRSCSNSLLSCPSTPLSPSVLDFSEYVSRQCERKLQRRVRQLTQRSNKQLATIVKLKRQIAASRTPLNDISNRTTTTLHIDHEQVEAAEQPTGESVEEVGPPDTEEAVEGEETGVSEQMLSPVTCDGEEETADECDPYEIDDSISLQEEGQQCTAAREDEEAETDEGIHCPPCSPISACRHKRGRTDDSEQCNTEVIDAQWKRAKEEEANVDDVQSDQQTATTHSDAAAATAALSVVHTLLPFKPALLHPFPTSHAHFQSNNCSGALTPYRGLLRPFPLAPLNHSPLRVTQLKL